MQNDWTPALIILMLLLFLSTIGFIANKDFKDRAIRNCLSPYAQGTAYCQKILKEAVE